jgi:leucine-rich repeat protein SHOC2
MEIHQVKQIIAQARASGATTLTLENNQLTTIPENIGTLSDLTCLRLYLNQLTTVPESIGNLSNLTHLHIDHNQLTSLPESIGNLSKLTHLHLYNNQLTSLPESIVNLSSLTHLYLDNNCLTSLPESIGNLTNLEFLGVDYNQLTSLPNSIGNLSRLTHLYLFNNKLTTLPQSISSLSNLELLQLILNPLTDLSGLCGLSELVNVQFLGVNLPRRYWKQIDKWKPKWLLDENNAAIRRAFVEHVGYEKICQELKAVSVDTWREYTLLQSNSSENQSQEDYEPFDDEPDEWVDTAFLALLKMTCPSTGHIHILRVPPETLSAEAAITWINHGIHPDRFAVQT